MDEEALTGFALIAMISADDLMSECDEGNEPARNSSARLDELLSEYDDVFNGLGRTHLIEHRIETTSDVPVVGRQYRLPVAYKDKAQAVIDQMISDGVVEPSDSDYMNPVVLVKKKGSDVPRVCIDFRALNSVTVKDRQPVPRVEDTIQKLANAEIFSLVDAKQGYYQIPLRKRDRKKTAFQFNGQLLQFTVLPFGLCNGPSTYNRLMQRITKDLSCVAAYFDDWCVFSSDETEHVTHLRLVLDRLRSAGLTLNRDKCQFMTSSLDSFLGFSVSQGSVRPTEEHVRAIEAVKRPTNQRELRRFLGLVGFYRAHVPRFSLIARPLHDLLRKSSTFHWDGAHETAFHRLRETLMSRPVLTIPTETSSFTVRTDASKDGVGCVLEADGRPVEFSSKAFAKPQRAYSVIEQEAYGIVHALKKWRHLLGRHFQLCTDHRPLVWLRSKKDLTGRLGRWALLLQEFDFTVEHISGQHHVVPDALSRSVPDPAVGLTAASPTTDVTAAPAAMSTTTAPSVTALAAPSRTEVEDWRVELRADDELQRLQQQQPSAFKTNQRGMLCHVHPKWGERLVVPESQRIGIITSLHDDQLAGHCGSRRTLHRIQERYFWPGMVRDVKQHVKACLACCRTKDTPVTTAPLMPVDTSTLEPWQKVALDIVGPISPTSESGARFIIVCQDYFTKWPELVAVSSTDAATVQRWLMDEVFCRYGFPTEIVTDQGTQWMSASFKSFCTRLGVTHRTTSPYHPQSDMVERFNRTLLNMIRAYLDENKQQWDQNLQSLAFTYRTTVCETTQATPFELVQCRRARLPIDVLHSSFRSPGSSDLMSRLTEVREAARRATARAAATRAATYDKAKHVKMRVFRVGDRVFWKRPINQAGVSPKLQPIWSGPFDVVGRVSDVNYRIRDSQGKTLVIHVNNLKMSHVNASVPSPVIRGRGRPRRT